MPTRGPAAVRSVAVWINLFIPFDLSGTTVPVRRGPHAGKSAVDIGSTLLLTDQRAFSHDPRAASRMHSYVTIDLSAVEPVVTIGHRVDPATACHRRTGAVLRQSRPSGRGMTARVASRDPVVVSLDCVASVPIPDVPAALRELAYRGTITYRPADRALAVDLMVGLFPATEGYGSVNQGAAAIVFRQAPLPVAAALAPVGPRRRIQTAFADGDGSGFFPEV
jgi:hypothetical protein